MAIATADKTCAELCASLGLDVEEVAQLVVVLQPGAPATVYVQMHAAPGRLVELLAPESVVIREWPSAELRDGDLVTCAGNGQPHRYRDDCTDAKRALIG